MLNTKQLGVALVRMVYSLASYENKIQSFRYSIVLIFNLDCLYYLHFVNFTFHIICLKIVLSLKLCMYMCKHKDSMVLSFFIKKKKGKNKLNVCIKSKLNV